MRPIFSCPSPFCKRKLISVCSFEIVGYESVVFLPSIFRSHAICRIYFDMILTSVFIPSEYIFSMCGKFNRNIAAFRVIMTFGPIFMSFGSPFQVIGFAFYTSGFWSMGQLVFVRVRYVRNRVIVYNFAANHYFAADIADIGIIRFFVRQIGIERFFVRRIVIVEKIR